MSDGYLILDDGDRVVQANPEAERILGVAANGPVDGLVGSDAGELFDRVTYAERDGEYEGEFVVGDDSQRYVSVETADLEDDGFVIGRLVTLRDVTERVQARTQLRQEREELDTLFANIADPVVEVDDRDGEAVVDRANPAFETTFGYDRDELQGEPLGEFLVPEDDDETPPELRSHEEDLREEVVRETADGRREFLLQIAVPERDTDSAFLLYTDITERKERQRELERQNERLEEFASVVSHDLRNPLNVATEYLSIAKRADDPEEFIDEAQTSLDRMEAMIEDVLTLAREGEDVAEPDTVELDLVAEMAWNNCDTKEADLVVEDSIQFEADPDRLLELLENTIRNAIDHGSEDVTITVGSLDDRFGFFVEDDGPGIADHVKDQVFDHGVTTAEDGTGFGLAIVDRIAEAHGWDVSATDGRDGGARFEFVVGDEVFQWVDGGSDAASGD